MARDLGRTRSELMRMPVDDYVWLVALYRHEARLQEQAAREARG
jgi:hypothetical protein